MSIRYSSGALARRRAALAAVVIATLPAAALAATYYPRLFDTKHGGSVCYARTYSDAFRKSHPSVKLTSIAIERRDSVSPSIPNSKKLFGATFYASTKSEAYQALADCKHQGSAISCQLESDGGQITVMRSGKGVIVKTRRVQIEGLIKDLEISSKKGQPTRSFTLTGHGKASCASVFD